MTSRAASLVLALTIVTVAVSCHQPFFRARPVPQPPPFVPPQSPNDIVEIVIAHTPCFGTCPVYRFVLRRSGPSVYEGGRFAAIQGRYEAVADSASMQTLAQLLLRRRFFEMDSILDLVIDAPSIEITAVLNDSRQRTVTAYRGSADFNEIAAAIDSIGARLPWRSVAR